MCCAQVCISFSFWSKFPFQWTYGNFRLSLSINICKNVSICMESWVHRRLFWFKHLLAWKSNFEARRIFPFGIHTNFILKDFYFRLICDVLIYNLLRYFRVTCDVLIYNLLNVFSLVVDRKSYSIIFRTPGEMEGCDLCLKSNKSCGKHILSSRTCTRCWSWS